MLTLALPLAVIYLGWMSPQEPESTPNGANTSETEPAGESPKDNGNIGDNSKAQQPARIQAAAALLGLEFNDSEIQLMLGEVAQHRDIYQRLWQLSLENELAPALIFRAKLPGMHDYAAPQAPQLDGQPSPSPARPDLKPTRPAKLEDLAFADLRTLSALIQSKQISCVELTEMYLARLHRLDAKLHCAISFCDERALNQARALDKELDAGQWRGPLHGIPWGAKDLLAVRGTKTTWGAAPYSEQVIDVDAEVVRRLDQAGAVLIAKLSLGALAWGDVWFGETTRNPWNPERGSSGSSAGPASATAAGCVAFAIGTETCGSILSPSAVCGVSSLRPSFGRISRHGAMALSWSMDKLGPMCRSAQDANLVFQVIQGIDEKDDSTISEPFEDLGLASVKGWKVGYLNAGKDPEYNGVLDDLRDLGAELVEVELPASRASSSDLLMILFVEAAAAFDKLTRSGRDDELVRQIEQAWPNVFRAARLIPAVEYINANRQRRQLMLDTDELWKQCDVLVHPTTHGETLLRFNLTGTPTACAPSGFRSNGTPKSVAFSGPMFSESALLALMEAWQDQTDHHLQHPTL